MMWNCLSTLTGLLLLLPVLAGCTTQGSGNPVNPFERILRQHLNPDRPGAVAIVAKDGEVLFRSAYGMADVEHRVPLTPDMPFRIGSLTKTFTAAAIMLLSDRGQLKVTDEIGEYLPDYPTHGERITIEHLLTHTSGIYNYTDLPDFERHMDQEIALSELIGRFRERPLSFTPGSRVAYSNSGYILLGAVIERVSGQAYCAFMQSQVFEPLGLNNTRCEESANLPTDSPIGYNRNEPAAAISMSQVYAAGALVSTVDDLARWHEVISQGELLQPSTWERVFTPFILNDGQQSNVGYGWGIGSVRGHRAVGHAGGINGFSSMMIRLPEEGVFVAVLSNDDRMHLLSRISAWLNDNSTADLAGQLALLGIGI